MPLPEMNQKERAAYDVALRLIQKCRRTGETVLDLSGIGLTHLPPEIGRLARLTDLNLSRNQLATLPPEIGQLTTLTEFRLTLNKLATLPPEIGQLTALTTMGLGSNLIAIFPPEIGQITTLTQLDLSLNQLSKLPPNIGHLTALEMLYLESNQLASLPPEVGQLTALTGLYLSTNQIATLPREIGQLTALKVLHLHSNQLVTLPPEIGQLTALTGLDLASNQLATLPPEIGQLTALTVLYLHNNPGLGIPESALGPRWQDTSSENPAASPKAILDYLFSIQGGKGRPLREVKVILVGRGEVGKSSMVEALMGREFVKNRERTDGIAITPWRVTLEDGETELKLWDFGGQEIMHGTHQFFMTHRSLYLVMVDGRHDRGQQDAEYWLKLARAFGGESPVMVVMNRQMGHPFDTDRERLSLKYNVDVEHFFRTDCADAKSIVPLQNAISSEVARMLSKEERFAASAWDVKTQLGNMKEAGLDYLSEQSYQDLCEKHGVTADQEQQALLRRLACIGTVVSFPDDLRMSALSVLNPEWATDGIYRVMTCEDLRERKHGVLSLKKLRDLLPKNRWPKPLHVQYVVDLMMKFDLCFPVDGNADTMLVPELLPDKTPPLGDWEPEKCVVFHYHYTVLPHGVLPRFITRTHLLSDGQERWRTGVILADDGAEARLQADYDANTLSIWVRGVYATARRGLLKVIRNHFEAIHSRIEGLDAKEMVAVPGHPEVLVPYRDVILDERAGQTTFRVSVEGERIAWPIAELLNGVESRTERKQAALDENRYLKMEVHGDYYAGDHHEKNTTMNDDHSIRLRDNYGQVGQTLNNCTNMIQLQPSGERKGLLEQLDREARELITELPEDLQKKASKNLELAVKSMTEEEPDRDWYDVSAKGLLEASKFVKDFSGNIAGTIKNLGISVWSDFKLPDA